MQDCSKKYSVIYADPPWWDNKPSNNIDRKYFVGCAARSHFVTMKTEDVCALPIRNFISDNCALFLWSTSRHIPDALRVIEAWGFRFVKIGFTWMKVTKSGKPAFGLGYYTKGNSEYCLLGIRGKMAPVNNCISEAILEPRTKIFTKPESVRRRIELLYGNLPRIELFARRKIEGWDVWGNEVDSSIDLLNCK